MPGGLQPVDVALVLYQQLALPLQQRIAVDHGGPALRLQTRWGRDRGVLTGGVVVEFGVVSHDEIELVTVPIQGSVTNASLRTPARCAAAIACATRS